MISVKLSRGDLTAKIQEENDNVPERFSTQNASKWLSFLL